MAGFEGTWLGPYHLLQRLGGGEISNVYLAGQRGQERQVAIKAIQQTEAAGSNKKQRQSAQKFTSQLQTITALKHPNLIPIYDFGEQNGVYYVAMEYMPFGSLADFLFFAPIQRYRLPLQPSLAADMMYQAAEALQFAHDHHTVHLDIKPRNLLLKVMPLVQMPSGPLPIRNTSPAEQVPSGEIPVRFQLVVADLYWPRLLASLSTQGSALLTPLYTAPEQFQGQPGPSTDQYTLAEVAYLLLTGETVFKGNTREIQQQQLSVTPRLATEINPQLPPMINGVLARALAKGPLERYPRIQDFGLALQQAASAAGQWHVYSLPKNAAPPLMTPQNPASGPIARPPSGARPEAAPVIPAQTPGWSGPIPPAKPPEARMPLSGPRSGPVVFPPAAPGRQSQDLERSPGTPLYREPDAPRAPLPPSAQKFVNYPRSPLRRWGTRIQELALWQRLVLVGLVLLLITSSVFAVFLVFPRKQIKPQVIHQVHVTTQSLIRYSVQDRTNFTALTETQTPSALGKVVMRQQTASPAASPHFNSNLPVLSADVAAQSVTSNYPSDLPAPQDPAYPVAGLGEQQLGDTDAPIDLTVASNGTTTIEVLDNDYLEITDATSESFALASFFQQPLSQGGVLAEPRILFMPALGQWILVANQLDMTENGVINAGFFDIALSESSDPTGKWDIYQLSTRLASTSNCTWADYPQIGANNAHIFITGTSFDCGQMGALRGAVLWDIPLSNLSPSQALETIYVATGFTTSQNSPLVTLTPALQAGEDHTGWLISTDAGYVDGGQVSKQVEVWAVLENVHQGTTAAPTIIRSQITLLSPYADPPSTQQRNSTHILTTGDARIAQAQFIGGHLYAAFTTAMNWEKDTTTRAGIYWFDLLPTLARNANPSKSTLTFVNFQQGLFGDPNTSFFYPALVADSFGNVILFCEAAGPSLEPHLIFTSRLSGDPLGTFGQGKDTYMFLPGDAVPYDGSHWGDYVGGALGPTSSDGTSDSIWIVGPQVVAGSGQWTTTIWTIPTKGA